MSHAGHLSRQQGFSLLELALVLALVGGMALIVMQYRGQALSQDKSIAQGYQDQIAAALFQYALRHYRLPCADTNGNGFEGGSDGACGQGSTNHMVGGVPFQTLNMPETQGLSEAVRQRYVYGVFRDNSTAGDLSTLTERTGDALGTSGYLSLNDLRYASDLKWPAGGGLCVSGPLTTQDEQYDDAIVAVGFAELLGYLTQ